MENCEFFRARASGCAWAFSSSGRCSSRRRSRSSWTRPAPGGRASTAELLQTKSLFGTTCQVGGGGGNRGRGGRDRCRQVGFTCPPPSPLLDCGHTRRRPRGRRRRRRRTPRGGPAKPAGAGARGRALPLRALRGGGPAAAAASRGVRLQSAASLRRGLLAIRRGTRQAPEGALDPGVHGGENMQRRAGRSRGLT